MTTVIEATYEDLFGPSPHDGKWTLALIAEDGTPIVARLRTAQLRETMRTLRGSGPEGACLCCDGAPEEPEPTVVFSRELLGGHQLVVTIPGLGTIDNRHTMALWRQMAEKLDELASHFKAEADAMANDAERLGPRKPRA